MKKKLFDSEGRLFGKISVIDICLVLLVIVLIFAVKGRFEKVDDAVISNLREPFTYEIKVKGLRDVSVNSLAEGDKLFELDTATPIGAIENIEVTKAQNEITTTEGNVIVVEMDDRYDVVLTVSTQGFVTAGRYFASGTYELSTNAPISFYSKYINCTGTVWSLLGEVEG